MKVRNLRHAFNLSWTVYRLSKEEKNINFTFFLRRDFYVQMSS